MKKIVVVLLVAIVAFFGLTGQALAAKRTIPATVTIASPQPVHPYDKVVFNVDPGSYANQKYLNLVVICYDYGQAPAAPDPQTGDSRIVWANLLNDINSSNWTIPSIFDGTSPWLSDGGNTDTSCRAALYRYWFKGSGQEVIRLSEWVYFTVDSPLDSRYTA